MAKVDIVDPTLLRVLDGQIETLTTSGKYVLDEAVMKDLKKILKQSEEFVSHSFFTLMPLLGKDHSEIRLSAFQIIDEIFKRSHKMRELVVDNFQRIMELVLETDASMPLPLPKSAANQLKIFAMKAVHSWNQKYSEAYRKLSLGYNYLKRCKQIDFDGMEARSIAQRRREEEEQRRKETIEREKVNTTLSEIEEMKGEMQACMTQAENCLMLLLPSPETFDIHSLRQLSSQSSYKGKNKRPSRRSSTKSNTSRPEIKQETNETSNNIDDELITKIKQEMPTPCFQAQEQCAAGNCNKETSQLEKGLKHKNVKCEFCKVKGCSENCSKVTGLANQVSQSDQSMSKSAAAPTETTIEFISENVPSSPKPDNVEGVQNSNDPENCMVIHSDSDDFEEMSSNSEDESGDEFEYEDEEEEEHGDSDLEDTLEHLDDSRRHGLHSKSMTVSVQFDNQMVQIEETCDNEDLLRSLNDALQLIQHRYMPALQKWIQVFTKVGDETQIKMCLDTREVLNSVLNKISRLDIKRTHKKGDKSIKEEESSDDDFEDVAEKDGFEADIPEHLKEKQPAVSGQSASKPTSQEWRPYDDHKDEEADPTSYQATIKHTKQQVKGKSATRKTNSKSGKVKEETPEALNNAVDTHPVKVKTEPGLSTEEVRRREKLLKQAPTLPFNTDLRHWGEEIETPLRVNYISEHRFWTPNSVDGDTVDKDALAAMTSRLINFTGKFERVKHQCRAPLTNGKLCPRMDRFKCPFHGEIVARDAVGVPIKEEDRAKEEANKKAKETVPAWEDEELQRDIEAATGKSLQREKKKRGRKRPPKYPNLTDINKKVNSSRSRLKNKVLAPKVLKRVANQLDIMDSKRANDKFGNQFNYALTNRM